MTTATRKPPLGHGRRSCKAVMARRLLSGAGLGYHPDAAARIIASAPRSRAEAEDPDPAASFCAFCLCAWERRPMDDGQYEEFAAVAAYWLGARPGEGIR